MSSQFELSVAPRRSVPTEKPLVPTRTLPYRSVPSERLPVPTRMPPYRSVPSSKPLINDLPTPNLQETAVEEQPRAH